MNKILFILTIRGNHGLLASMECCTLQQMMMQDRKYKDIRYINLVRVSQNKEKVSLFKNMQVDEFKSVFSIDDINQLKKADIISENCNKSVYQYCYGSPTKIKNKEIVLGNTYSWKSGLNKFDDVQYLGKFSVEFNDSKYSYDGRTQKILPTRKIYKNYILFKENNYYHRQSNLNLYKSENNINKEMININDLSFHELGELINGCMTSYVDINHNYIKYIQEINLKFVFNKKEINAVELLKNKLQNENNKVE